MFGRKASLDSSNKGSPSGRPKKRLLTVEIVDAKNLIPCARNGTSDPFLSLTLVDLGGREIKAESFKTTQKNGTIAPSWVEKFVFGKYIGICGFISLFNCLSPSVLLLWLVVSSLCSFCVLLLLSLFRSSLLVTRK
jgi:hypothetical protein